MSLKQQVKIITKNKIRIFKKILVDDELNNLLLTNNIKVKIFLNNFLVPFFDDFIEDFKSKEDEKIIKINVLFLVENSISSKDIFLILKIIKNSIISNIKNENYNIFDLNKNINKIYDMYTLFIFDIEFKDREKHRERNKKLFLEQSKLAAMGELISMIAHQWRQPLQTVSILVQKLILTKTSQGYVDNDVLEKSVKAVDEQLDYMSKTIDDFRNFFKPQSEKYICSLSSIVDKSIKFLHYLLTINNIDIRIEIINDIEFTVHENNIIQVLINILKNAKDVLVERNIENKFVQIRCNFNEKYAIIEIEDSAGGIKDEDIKKVFKSYFTTKDDDEGTGLGLYMSKIVIEEHSLGKLSVKNGINGAIFTIELPLK